MIIILPYTIAIAAFLALVIVLVRFKNQTRVLQKAENALAHQKNLSALLYSIPVPISIIENNSGKFAYTNEAFIRMLNLSSQEDALKKSIYDVTADIQGDGETKADKFRKVLDSGGTLFQEVVFRVAKDDFIDTYLISSYLDYNGRPCTMCVLKDITAEKKSQRILYSALKREQDENSFLTGVLKGIGGETKSPANTIISLSEVLLASDLTPETAYSLHKISDAAKNLTQIIDDNLIAADIETDDFSLVGEEFELDDVLSAALMTIYKQLAVKGGVALLLNTSLELPRYIIGDKRRLLLTLKGFLNNSAEYAKDGKIVLSVSPDNDRTNDERIFINFMIKDTGVSDERQRHLTQTGGANPAYGADLHASGISQRETNSRIRGVQSARKLCGMMGGEHTTDTDASGVLFRFTIPFNYPPNRETTMQAIDTPMLFGLNMLLVDGDELSLKIMQRLLKCSNVNCYLARSGKEALDLAAKYRDKGLYFDVVLLDCAIEGGDNPIAKIRLSFLNPPKIILLTEGRLDDAPEMLYVDEIIEKPFVPTRFIQKICGCLGSKALHEEAHDLYTKYNNARVLICDDNIINQEITARMLDEFNVSHITADNGKKAVEIIMGGLAVDIIFMDLYMPIMDGFEATQLIRADSRFDNVPIISLSADTMPQVIDKCIESGMNGHLPKPIEFRALNDLLKRRLPAGKRMT